MAVAQPEPHGAWTGTLEGLGQKQGCVAAGAEGVLQYPGKQRLRWTADGAQLIRLAPRFANLVAISVTRGLPAFAGTSLEFCHYRRYSTRAEQARGVQVGCATKKRPLRRVARVEAKTALGFQATLGVSQVELETVDF